MALVILPYLNAISIDFYAVKCLIYIFLFNFHVCKWKNAYIKDLNALRILINFLCIYLGEGRGVALMHVYVWEDIVSLNYRTTEWMFMKFGRDEVLMALHMH